MKHLVLLSVLCLSLSNAMAGEKKLLKTCSTDVPNFASRDGNATVKLDINIFSEAGKIHATISSKSSTDSQADAQEQVASIEEFDISEGAIHIDAYSDEFGSLNNGEMLLSHAYSVASDEELRTIMNPGLDVTKVTKVKVYQIGQPTRYGQVSVVEAYDKDGKDLGSFLGGFLVGACKK